MDENHNHTLILREQLTGSIVVMLEQKTRTKKTAQNGIFYGVNDSAKNVRK